MEWIDFDKIVKKEFSKERRKPGHLFVSDMGRCLRKAYYEYFDPKEVSEELWGIFAVGDMMHKKISDMLFKEFKKVSSEKDVVIVFPEFDLSVTGRYDDIVYSKDDAILVEKKSTSKIAFIKFPNFPDLIQTYIYMYAKGLKQAQILYTEKNSFAVKSFNIEFDKTFFVDVVMQRIKNIAECIQKKELPEAEARTDAKKVWQCKYCKHLSECTDNINRGV